MKNTIILATFSVLLFTSCSKSGVDDNGTGNTTVVDASAVPQASRTSFNNDFSGATGVEWQRNSSTSFTVQFNHTSVILPDTMIAATSHHIVLYAWMHLCHK